MGAGWVLQAAPQAAAAAAAAAADTPAAAAGAPSPLTDALKEMPDCMACPPSRKRSCRPVGSKVTAHGSFWLVLMAASAVTRPLTLVIVARASMDVVGSERSVPRERLRRGTPCGCA